MKKEELDQFPEIEKTTNLDNDFNKVKRDLAKKIKRTAPNKIIISDSVTNNAINEYPGQNQKENNQQTNSISMHTDTTLLEQLGNEESLENNYNPSISYSDKLLEKELNQETKSAKYDIKQAFNVKGTSISKDDHDLTLIYNKILEIIREVNLIIEEYNKKYKKIMINDDNVITYNFNSILNSENIVPANLIEIMTKNFLTATNTLNQEIENKTKIINEQLDQNKPSWWWCATIILAPWCLIKHMQLNTKKAKLTNINSEFKSKISEKLNQFENSEDINNQNQQIISQLPTSRNTNTFSSLVNDEDNQNYSETTPLLSKQTKTRYLSN